MNSMLSLFASITHSWSVSLEELKLIVTVNWIFYVSFSCDYLCLSSTVKLQQDILL